MYLVMEYVEHELRELLDYTQNRGVPFLMQELKCLIIQLLKGVAFMHKHSFIHRY